MSDSSGYNVAVLGASGAVGMEIVNVLERRSFPVKELRLLASPRSAGRKVNFRNTEITIEPVSHDSFQNIDFAFFSAGSSTSKEFAPSATKAGAVVIDNTSAFRMDENIPLVVPEVNASDLASHPGIIANPNCCAAILAAAIWPIHQAAGIKRIIVSTYQSASGAGAQAMAELEDQVKAFAQNQPIEAKVFPHQAAFNVFSHNSPVGENGYNVEENKLVEEIQKIFHIPDLPIVPTCIRVPVLRAHSESVVLDLEKPLSPEEARTLLEKAPGIQVVDSPADNLFPMPLDASGKLDILVGRIRRDSSNPTGLALFISGDQLLKGAAWNSVQIAEELINQKS